MFIIQCRAGSDPGRLLQAQGNENNFIKIFKMSLGSLAQRYHQRHQYVAHHDAKIASYTGRLGLIKTQGAEAG